MSYFGRDTFLRGKHHSRIQKRDRKWFTNISLTVITSDVPWTPKLQREKKEVTQEGLMVDREEGDLCPFLEAETPTHRGLCCWWVFSKLSSTHTRWRFFSTEGLPPTESLKSLLWNCRANSNLNGYVGSLSVLGKVDILIFLAEEHISKLTELPFKKIDPIFN